MFRSKKDVDKHVSSILLRKKDERERNSQGYQIARLYADIKEYSTARRYLSGFLSVRENLPSAYQLMGEISEGLDMKEAAIDSYKRALDLGGFVSSNRHLVQKICELYIDIGTDVPRMKHWLEKIEKLDPKSDKIFAMKAKIAEADNENGNNKTNEMENIISSELVKKPTDLKLRIKLLQLYLDTDRTDEAYDVAVTCDLTTAFVTELSWFDCLQAVFKKYGDKNKDSATDTAYNHHYLHVLRNMVYLSLSTKDVSACAQALSRFDKQLKKTTSVCTTGEADVAMLKEMKGQVFFLAALVLIKRAQDGGASWQDINPLSAACLLACKNMDPLDAQAPWFVSAPSTHVKFYSWWQQQSYDRLSQVGHLLYHLSGKKTWDEVTEWTKSIRRDTMTSVGHQHVFECLYQPRDAQADGADSFLYGAAEMVSAGSGRDKEPFTEQSLLDIDRVAYQVHLGDLNHLVWLCLQRYSTQMAAQPNYHFSLMENIQFSVKNLENTAAETLCQLDLLVFLLATVRCAASSVEDSLVRYADTPGRPCQLPVMLSRPLVTTEQREWWDAAYRFCTNTVKDDFSRLRRVLVRGLETLRVTGSHGISIKMMMHIAKSLDNKVKSYRSSQHGARCPAFELSQLETRAAFYWEKAKQALLKTQRNQHTPMPKKRLFKEGGVTDLSSNQIKICLDEVEFALAVRAMKTGNLEEALDGFDKLKLRGPWPKFYSAKIYKQQSDQEADRDGESYDSLQKRKALAEKARECLYKTIDRLEGDKTHELNVPIYRELDELEVILHDLEMDDRNPSPNNSFHTPVKSPSDMRGATPGVTPGASPAVRMSHLAHSTPRPSSSGASHYTNGSNGTPAPHYTNGTNGTPAPRASRADVTNGVDEHEISSTSDHRDSSHIRSLHSPEKLDAQMKSIRYSQSSMFKMVLDRNDELITINSKLMEELRDNNNQIKSVLTENQSLMGELKNFLGENRDMMKQIKNELTSLKTGLAAQQAAPAQMPTMAQTPPLFLPPHMAPGVQPRGPPYPAFPPPAYPHGYMINNPMAGPLPPRPPAANMGYRHPNVPGMPGAQQSNVGKYPSPSDLEDEVDPDDLASAEEAAALYAEFCDDTAYSQYFTPEAHMMQDWAGGRPGMDGSTPLGIPQSGPGQMGPPRMSMPSPGYFASALRGPSLQYAQSTPPPSQVKPPPLGPGFFSSPLVSVSNTSAAPTSSGSTAGLAAVSSSATMVPNSAGQTPTLLAALTGQQATPEKSATVPAANSSALSPALSGLKSLFQSKGCLEPSKTKGDITILVDTNSKRATILMMGETREIIFHHDISGLTLELPTFTSVAPSQVAWTATKIGTPGLKERVAIGLETPVVAGQLKEAIQKAIGLIGSKAATPGPFGFGTPPASLTPIAQTSAVASSSAAPASTGAGAATVFAGFTFSQTPVITNATAVTEKPKAEPHHSPAAKTDAPKPFANFSLVTPAATSPVKPAPIAQQSPPKALGKTGGGDDDHVEEYEPNVDFKPVIALPDLVEKKTGEENESSLFVERCRLYRFDVETKQWKERGIGELKILESNEELKFRIIMRRDQIFKLCANHCLASDMKLTPMHSSDRAWCYTAQDYSDETMKLEQLAAKFKNPEKATAFKDIFTDCCQQLKDAENEQSDSQIEDPSEQEVTSSTVDSTPKKSLADLFKPKEGSWECGGCLCRNNGDVVKCPACGTIKPGAKPPPAAASSTSGITFGAGGGFTFGNVKDNKATVEAQPSSTTAPGTQTSLADLFKPKEGSWECGGCLCRNNGDVIKCPACGTIKPGAKPPPPAAVSSTSGGFSFGGIGGPKETGFKFGGAITATTTAPTGGFSFGSTTTATPASTTAPTGGFVFGGSAVSKPAVTSAPAQTSTSTTGGFIFGGSAVKPAVTSAPAQTSTSTTGGFVFGGSAVSKNASQSSSTPIFKAPAPVASAPAVSSTVPPVATSATAAPFSFNKATTVTTKPLFPFTPSAPAETTPAAAASKPSQSGGSPSKGGLLAELLTANEKKPAEQAVSKPEAGGFSFSLPAKSNSSTSTASTENSSPGFNFSFTKTPQKSATSPVKPIVPGSPEIDEHGMYITKDGEDSHIHFEPVVALPDKIEVKTGEEEESILFESRGKIYRFVSGEWKEKGLGVVKILEHCNTKKTRVLMRRDQILKICCNHSIDPSLNLQPMAKSEGKAWVWYAMDFSEEEGKMEQLALRFKTAEIADEFKTVFDKCRASYEATPPKNKGQDRGDVAAVKKNLFSPDNTPSYTDGDDDDVIFVKEEQASPEQIKKARSFKLPDNFYLYEQKAPCPGCLGCTDGEVTPQILAAMSSKKDKEVKQEVKSPVISAATEKKAQVAATPQSNIFGGASSLGNKPLFGAAATPSFGSTVNTSTPKFGLSSVPVFGGANTPVFGGANKPVFGSAVPTSQPTFGSVSANLPDFSQLTSDVKTEDKTDVKEGESSFVFGSKATVDFSSLAASSGSAATEVSWRKSESGPFSFADAGQKLFGGSSSGAGGHGADGDVVAPSDDIHFEPVIPLPDLVKVTTGEEDWKTLFRHRSKVYKFDKSVNQWKERGVGEIKVMQHNTQCMYRVLQRREQVLKVSCNHLITADMELKAMSTSETAWCWIAQDFTDSEASIEKFAVKFKTKETAQEFKTVFEECQQNLRAAEKTSAESNQAEPPVGVLTERVVDEEYDDEEDDDDDDDDYEDEDEEELLYEKRATLSAFENGSYKNLGTGTLVVTYNEDINGNAVSFMLDSGEKLCSHIITRELHVKCHPKNRSCEWAPIDYATDEPVRRHFAASFSSTPAAVEFRDIFEKGQKLAVQSDLSENLSKEIDIPEVFSSGEPAKKP